MKIVVKSNIAKLKYIAHSKLSNLILVMNSSSKAVFEKPTKIPPRITAMIKISSRTEFLIIDMYFSSSKIGVSNSANTEILNPASIGTAEIIRTVKTSKLEMNKTQPNRLTLCGSK